MDAEVLVTGAGPVGLTAALELRRRDVEVIVVARLLTPAPFAKAGGIQPDTVELWDSAGVSRAALDAALMMRGQIVYVDGAQVAQMELRLPDEIPTGSSRLPRYEAERVLTRSPRGLRDAGAARRRVHRLLDGRRDDQLDGARCRGERTVRSRYLVGCDGAHSAVRKGLGLAFEGGAFGEEYMLADVELDWDMPAGYSVRVMHQTDGVTDDPLVWITLPGHMRYRVSMLVPDELSTKDVPADGITHGRRPGAAAVPHPGRARPALAAAHDRRGHALVVGVPHQPPAGGPLRRRPGVRGRGRRPHPSADRGAGPQHGRAGRVQPGLEAALAVH